MGKEKEVQTFEQPSLMNLPVANNSKTLKSLTSIIGKELNKVESSYLKVATTLYQIYVGKLFALEDYSNVYDFADDKFNLSRGTVSNFINIVSNFCEQLSDGSYKLKEEFKDFKPSQLVVLLNMPQDFISAISPDMSVRAIKEVKREYKNMVDSVVECEECEECEDGNVTDLDDVEVRSEGFSKKEFVFGATNFSHFFDDENLNTINEFYSDFKEFHKDKNVILRLYVEVL